MYEVLNNYALNKGTIYTSTTQIHFIRIKHLLFKQDLNYTKDREIQVHYIICETVCTQ